MASMADDDRRAALGGRFRASRFWRAFPAGMRRRWWLFRAFDLIARHWPIPKERRGLLVVRMDGIGDMVLFRHSLDHYAEAFHVDKSDIWVLGCASWGSVADRVFEGYRVRVIDEHAFARRPLYRFRISVWVRRLAPAAVVCDSYFRRALMADSLVWVAGAPRTVVSLPYISERTRPEYTWYLSQVDEIIDTGVYPTHEVIRHHRFVSRLSGREIPPRPPAIPWRPAPPPVEDGAPYVVLNPGSNEPGRRWPHAGYAALARRLLDGGYRVAVIGKGDEDLGELSALPVIDLSGRTTVAQLMDLLASAAAVISNDSGPAHLSIALGAPTVVIVGGGHMGCFVPYPDGVAPDHARFVFHEMECYHCFWRCTKRAAEGDVFPCIGTIAEDQVWDALQGLLGGDNHGQ